MVMTGLNLETVYITRCKYNKNRRKANTFWRFYVIFIQK